MYGATCSICGRAGYCDGKGFRCGAGDFIGDEADTRAIGLS